MLTFRDMNSMIRAGALQGYEALVRNLGADPVALLRQHEIDPDALKDPETLISLNATIELLETSAKVINCPDFGLRLASTQDTGILGLLAIVIQNAPDLLQAVADASRYLFLHSPAYEITLDQRSPLFDDCLVLRFGIRAPALIQQRQILDGCLGLISQFGRLLGADKFVLRGVSLPHTPLAAEKSYRRHFGAPVHFAQPYAGLHVHRDLLNADLKVINPMLRQLALDYIAQRVPPRTLLLVI